MSAWYVLEDCKTKAAAILGSNKDIPKEKADLGKLSQAVGAGTDAINALAQELAEKLDNYIDAVDKWDAGLKQTVAIYQNDDFGLDKKADAPKIAKARKCFAILSGEVTTYDGMLSDLKKTRTQCRTAMKQWL